MFRKQFACFDVKVLCHQISLILRHLVGTTSSARNIGVMMDSKASMEAHVLSVCKSCFIHIRNLSRIKKFVDSSSLECLVHAFITTKLDYCNSLLCGAPSTLINKLQRIQNIVARIITGHGRCEHITPVLKALHWLPVQQRIKFKTLVRAHCGFYAIENKLLLLLLFAE